MAIRRTVSLETEVASIGQFDRLERWTGNLVVTREPDGRVRLTAPGSQAGFESLAVDWDDLVEAVGALPS